MITVRRAEERHRHGRGKREAWLTFDPKNRADPFADGFGTLEILEESRLPPAAGIPRQSRHEAEIVTYVREGALAYEDSTGHTGVVQAGEFHRMTAGRGFRHGETNVSRTDSAHVFQLWLRSASPGLEPDHRQKRFSVAERRSRLCLVASPDGRRGSLPIHQDARIYSAILDLGQHLVHELSEGRSAWLHLVRGEVTLDDTVLTTGDGAGFSGERAISLTAREESEILLFDLGELLPGSPRENERS
jgi:redox-sensitive bicupin YhaK (pirin superfamily)